MLNPLDTVFTDYRSSWRSRYRYCVITFRTPSSIRATLRRRPSATVGSTALTFRGHAGRIDEVWRLMRASAPRVPSPAHFRRFGHEAGEPDPTVSAPQRAPVTERAKLSQRSSEFKRGIPAPPRCTCSLEAMGLPAGDLNSERSPLQTAVRDLDAVRNGRSHGWQTASAGTSWAVGGECLIVREARQRTEPSRVLRRS